QRERNTVVAISQCQAASCKAGVIRLVAQLMSFPPPAQVPCRPRPPLAPTTMAAYAGLPAEVTGARHATRGLRPTWGGGAHPLQPPAPLPGSADVVIVGGGIMGLALAWNLAGKGAGRVLVLERGYLCEGASGRNGGGVRAQWTTPTLIELAKESIAF